MEGQNMSATTEKWTIFGERLKAELERQGMSLRQFSGKTGITLNTAFRYVHSQRIPRATEILKAAKVLGVTCDYMLGLSDDPHKTRDGWANAGFHELPSAQPVAKDINVPVKDCIGRQAAIDVCNNAIDLWHGQLGEGIVIAVKKKIEELPSAQPEPCEDAVSREEANPTIEPQRKKGRWIKKTIKKKIENDYSCSECGRHVSVMRGYDVRLVYPFCHCGADMTEGEG